MKTLEEIKNDYAFERGYENFRSVLFNSNIDNQLLVLNEISRRYAIEVARQALKNASKNASYYFNDVDNQGVIIDEDNIPNLD